MVELRSSFEIYKKDYNYIFAGDPGVKNMVRDGMDPCKGTGHRESLCVRRL